jgi:hypothetical protein
MKAKYFCGFNRKGDSYHTEHPILPGARNEAFRKDLKWRIDDEGYNITKTNLKTLGKRGNCPALVEF